MFSFIWQRWFYQFPSLSEEKAIKIVNFFGAENGEEIADLELCFVFSCSFIFSLLMVLFGSIGVKMLTKTSS
jgi:hypothetical protein